jgi:hypothetical protein
MGVGWSFFPGVGNGSSFSSGWDLMNGVAVVSFGTENEPVSIQVSWPEGFLMGLLKNQRSPPITATWIRATTMSALRKRGSCALMVDYCFGPWSSGRVITPTLEMPAR